MLCGKQVGSQATMISSKQPNIITNSESYHTVVNVWNLIFTIT